MPVKRFCVMGVQNDNVLAFLTRIWKQKIKTVFILKDHNVISLIEIIKLAWLEMSCIKLHKIDTETSSFQQMSFLYQYHACLYQKNHAPQICWKLEVSVSILWSLMHDVSSQANFIISIREMTLWSFKMNTVLIFFLKMIDLLKVLMVAAFLMKIGSQYYRQKGQNEKSLTNVLTMIRYFSNALSSSLRL